MHTVLVVLLFWSGLSLLAAAVWSALHERRTYRRSREYLEAGTPRVGGSERLYASTGTREHGTRTPGTDTTAECSSSSLRGIRLEGNDALTYLLRESSSSVPGAFTFVMGGRGASGEPPERAV